MDFTFKNAKYIKTAVKKQDYPILRDRSGNLMPEIAVVGRSNVGKSSLLNYLFQSKGLVKTSSQPGKTQAINFFTVDDALAFVDLPGYGYAKVPMSTRKHWGPMIEGYLESRETLKLILFLFDIRRTPTEEDIALLNWISYHKKEVILVITKIDKVNQSEKHANPKQILEAFGWQQSEKYVLCSAVKETGRHELIKKILTVLK